jgi:hypothetical protein
MDKEEKLFEKIAAKLTVERRDVAPGKMMSSPGIRYKNKVFAFYHQRDKEMLFRLGKAFEPEKFKIKKFSLLNPFKNKPPMAGWFQLPFTENRKWKKLARHALEVMAEELVKK